MERDTMVKQTAALPPKTDNRLFSLDKRGIFAKIKNYSRAGITQR